jgi:hypothetical protein
MKERFQSMSTREKVELFEPGTKPGGWAEYYFLAGMFFGLSWPCGCGCGRSSGDRFKKTKTWEEINSQSLVNER